MASRKRPTWPSALVAAGLVVLLAMCAVTAVRTRTPAPLPELSADAVYVPQRGTFYDDARWHEGVVAARDVEPEPDIAGIVVPHHLLAAHIIGGMFARAADDTVRLVVVVGPNHDQIGPYPIATVDGVWATPFGEVATDVDALASLEAATDARQVPELFAGEHAAGALMPFIATEFPHARVVTAMLRTEAGESEARALDAWLATLDPVTTRVVFSLDFSHYLTREVAERHDAETRRAMVTHDLGAVARMDNGYVDSRATLLAAMLMADRLGGRLDETFHANSDDYGLSRTSGTTSYFGLAVRRFAQ